MKEEFYCDGGEFAYPINWWVNLAYDEQRIVTIELQKADIRGGNMWCKHHGEFAEPGCFKGCDAYDPRNKVSGRCRDYVYGLTGTGIKYNIHPDGRVEKVGK